MDEAGRLGHGYVGTEHLLLGLLSDHRMPSAQALMAAGATAAACRGKVAELVGDADGRLKGAGGPELGLSERAKRALERAERLSLRRRHDYVDTRHVLISVLDVEGRAGQVLRGVGVDVGALRTSVAAAVEDKDAVTTANGEPPRLEPRPLRCSSCGAALSTSIAHQTLTSRNEVGDERSFVIAFCSGCGTALGATAP